MSKYNCNNKRLNVAEFQHPVDRKAVNAVLAVPGFEEMLKYVSDHSIERVYSFFNSSSMLKISNEMSPKIHQMLEEAAQMYGTDVIPDLYLQRNYEYFIDLDGMAKPYVVLSSAWLEAVDDQMLWAVLTAQIAGIQAKHGMIEFIGNILDFTKGMLPFGVDAALDVAIKEWKRSRVYTTDRAILLATENFELAAKCILFGDASNAVLEGIGLDKPDNTYYQQAQEFIHRSGAEGMIQKVQTLFSSNQWIASRYIELYNWYFSGEYDDVLEGSLDV